jgi:retron-type reverse transcriptase
MGQPTDHPQKGVHSSAMAPAGSRKIKQAGRSGSTGERSAPPPLPMKTENHLYEKIYDFANLHAAYKRARLGKRDRLQTMVFEQDLEGNLIQLQNELIWGLYETGEYRRFNVYEPKLREIAALPFRDRVLQHALCHHIEPLWEKRFIADSYACRPGRGMHRCADRAQAMLRAVQRQHGKVYVLKLDVAKFFASVDHAILKRLLRKHIACQRTLWLCDGIVDSYADHKGLPIGNLTSQLWANVYLHELDLFAKHTLKARHYLRYMDDVAIIHHDKGWLHQVRREIDFFLETRLALTSNAKTQVFPVARRHGRGLDYIGYHLWPTHRRLRKSSIRRMARTLRIAGKRYARGRLQLAEIRQSIMSWVAHASHADAFGLRSKLLGNAVFVRGQAAQGALS